MDIKAPLPLEKPEGMPESVEITKDSRRVTIGKMKPGQNLPTSLTITGNPATDVITITPIKSTDGTYYFDLPKTYNSSGGSVKSIKHTLSFNITRSTDSLPCKMDINVRIPPTKLEVFDKHHLEQSMSETLKKGASSNYDIK